MKIKVFYPDRNGNIVFTKEELEKLLDEVYNEGYNDARPYIWNGPYNGGTITTPYYTTISSSSSTGECSNATTTATKNSSIPYTFTSTEEYLNYSQLAVQYKE